MEFINNPGFRLFAAESRKFAPPNRATGPMAESPTLDIWRLRITFHLNSEAPNRTTGPMAEGQ